MRLGIFAATLCLTLSAFGQDVDTVDTVEKAFWNKNYEEAAKASRALASEATEKAADARYYLAMTLLETDKPAEAEQELKAAREAGLSDDKYNVVLGRLAMERKQFPEAKNRFGEAIQSNPKNWQASYYRGLSYAATNDFANAVADFDKSITLHPENYLAHYFVGVGYNRIKRPDLMVKHWEQVIKLAPDSEEAQKAKSLMRSVR